MKLQYVDDCSTTKKLVCEVEQKCGISINILYYLRSSQDFFRELETTCELRVQ